MQKQRKKKRLNDKKMILLVFTIMIIVFLLNYEPSVSGNLNAPNFQKQENEKQSSTYPIIKKDTNQNYSGIGQQKVKNSNGYFTTFTTGPDHPKTFKEYKQNGNSSWSQKSYWGGTMAENGCGITAMSIILSGYQKEVSPESLRKKYYPVLDGVKISQQLSSTFGIKNSDFYFDKVHLSNHSIESHLKTNRPILICVWNQPTNNRWTTASHYMVLLASDDNGMVYVSNPNGLENDSKSSGWYDLNEITPFLAKALFIEKY